MRQSYAGLGAVEERCACCAGVARVRTTDPRRYGNHTMPNIGPATAIAATWPACSVRAPWAPWWRCRSTTSASTRSRCPGCRRAALWRRSCTSPILKRSRRAPASSPAARCTARRAASPSAAPCAAPSLARATCPTSNRSSPPGPATATSTPPPTWPPRASTCSPAPSIRPSCSRS
jgi:hypothetical protein